MYYTSSEYKTAIESKSRVFTWKGSITLKDGTVIPLDTTNIAQNGITFNSELFDNDMPWVGGTCSAEADVTIITEADRFKLYGATVELLFSLLVDEDNDIYEDVPIGIFYVHEAERAGDKRIKLVCYDAMSKFEKEARVNTNGTPFQILSLCCQQCGVTLGDSEQYIEDNFVNGALELTSYVGDNNIATWRQCVGFVAAILGANAVINREGELHLVADSTDEYGTVELYSSKRFSADIGDFSVGVRGISATNPDTGKEVIIDSIVQGGETQNIGYLLELGLNPLMPIDEQAINQIVSDIRDELYGKYTTPFDANIPADPSFDLGDHVNLYDLSGEYIGEGIIAKVSLKSSGGMTITGVGVFPEANSTNNERLISGKENEVNWDSTYYYDYKNSAAFTIHDGEYAQIINLVYNTGASTHVDFHGQVKATIVATEQYSSYRDTYTYNDVIITAKIFVDGEEQSYRPVWTFTDGVQTLDFLYFYKAAEETTGTITVWLYVANGNVSIGIGDSIGYVCGANYKDDVVAVGITQYPDKTEYYVGENFDYSGLVVQAQLKSGNLITVTSGCELTPADGSIAPEVEHKTYVNAEVLYLDLNNNRWVNNLSFLIRPENRLRNIAYFVVSNGTSSYVIYLDVANKTIVDTPYIRMRDSHPYQDPHYSLRTSNAGVQVSPGRIATFGSAYNTPFTHWHIQPKRQLPTIDGFIQFYNDSSSSTIFHFDRVHCNTTEDTPAIVRIGDYDFGVTNPYALGYYSGAGGGEFLNYRGKVCFIIHYDNGAYKIVAYYVGTDTFEFIGSVPSNYSPHSPSVAIDELDKSYTFFCPQYLYGDTTDDFHMIVYSDGEAHVYNISSDIVLPSWYSTFGGNTYPYPRLYYDPVAEEILLYICYAKRSNLGETETKCFRIAMDGHTVLGEVVLPDTITVSGRTVVLTGDPSGGIPAVGIFHPSSNYGYYNDEGNNVPYPFIVGYLTNSAAVPDEYAYEKLIFIDNLYFNESDGNMIL